MEARRWPAAIAGTRRRRRMLLHLRDDRLDCRLPPPQPPHLPSMLIDLTPLRRHRDLRFLFLGTPAARTEADGREVSVFPRRLRRHAKTPGTIWIDWRPHGTPEQDSGLEARRAGLGSRAGRDRIQ